MSKNGCHAPLFSDAQMLTLLGECDVARERYSTYISNIVTWRSVLLKIQ